MLKIRQLVALCIALCSFSANAQRGLILTPASTDVMDPNGDGYVSLDNTGFSNDGYYLDEFEFQMFALPVFGDGDVLNDTQAGPNCGSTDLTVDPDGQSAYAVLDADNNLIFRLRLADENPAVKAYTILIDTDGAIGSADDNFNESNLGFEIDITLIKSNSKGILVYAIDGITGCPTPVLEYDLSSNFQLSIADEVSCGDEDYFYDFYVPFGDLTTEFGITVNSELQFAVVTNISATCALGGSLSDIGGVDDNEYAGCTSCAFEDLSSNQCPVPFSSLMAGGEGFLSGATPTPTMEVPLKEGDVLITGTAAPTAELTVEIFDLSDNRIATEIATTDADSIWTISLSGALMQGDSVTAVAQITGSCDSGVTGSQLSFAVVVLNTTPIIDGTATTLAYAENDGAIPIDPGVLASDNEDLDFESATISIINGFESSEDALEFVDQLGITGSYNSGTGVLTLSGDASVDDYNTALQTVSYINSSENPVESIRTVEFIINDATEDSAPFTRDISVSAVNDPPVLIGTTGSTEFITPPPDFIVNSSFSISDFDDTQIEGASIKVIESATNNFVDGDELIFANQLGINGFYNTTTGILDLSGSADLADYATAINSIHYNYTPPGASNLNTRRVEFSVSDGDASSNFLNHFITFAAATNFPPDVLDEDGFPVVDGIITSVLEDGTISICLNVNDPDGDLVTITSATGETNGTLSLVSELCLLYEPDDNFDGSETITVIVCDAVGNCDDPVDIEIDIISVNDAPSLAPSTANVDERTTTSVCIDPSDIIDIEDDDHVFTMGISDNGATIEDGSGGDLCFDYTPPDGFVGVDAVEVTICDAADPTVCTTGNIDITVVSVNDSPIILVNGIVSSTMTVDIVEDTAKVFCFEVIDIDGDDVSTLSITNVSGGGSITEDATEFCYNYTPEINDNNSSVWDIVISDDAASPLQAEVRITINIIPVNDPPSLDELTIEVNEKTTSQVCVSATDVEGDSHAFISGVSQFASATIEIGDPDDMCFNYTPPDGFIGIDEVEVTICDISDPTKCDTGIITINVIDVNDPPEFYLNGLITNSIQVSGEEDTPMDICITAVDPEGDNVALTSNIIAISGGGIMTIADELCLNYSPEENVTGNVLYEIEACDDNIDQRCNTLQIEINLSNVNDPPKSKPDTLLVIRKKEGTINVLANDSDIDNDNLSLQTTLLKEPSGGVATINTNGTISYVSDITFRGVDSLVYVVQDSGTPTLTATGILIIRVDDEPFTIYQTVSPNGDGINDYWHIEGIDFYPGNSVRLYDRYNNLVFELDGYNNEDKVWVGQSNRNSNKTLPEGTYFYRISAGEAGTFGGFVVLRGVNN